MMRIKCPKIKFFFPAGFLLILAGCFQPAAAADTFDGALRFLGLAPFNISPEQAKRVERADYTGEKIEFVISPMGVAEYNDMGSVVLEGKNVKLVTFKTDAMGFSDLEKIYCDPNTLLPLRVERDVSFLFSKEYLVEEYKPKEFSLHTKKYVDGKEVKEYRFKGEGPINNAILVPFYLRTIAVLKPGWFFTAHLPDAYIILLVSIDQITVPAGNFQAYHFVSQPRKFEFWISQDRDRLPLKIKDTAGYGYTMLMKNRVFNKK